MYYVGIDLGGTNIVAGVVDEKYNLVSKASCKTNAPRPEADICDDMASVTRKAVEQANLTMDDIVWVGIGAPGTVNSKTGIVEFLPNLGYHNWNVAQMMTERLNKKVMVENDANAAAYGEYLAGAAKNAKNAVAITLGTGVGGGIIIDGKIYSGSNYAGAELGHMVIEYNGRKCGCGRKGCWEAYASATGLIQMTREAIEEENDSESCMYKMIEGDLNKVSGLTAFNAMRAGDKSGAKVVDKYISYLACGLVNVINIFQPDVLCIGGGISREGDTLIKPIMKIVEAERMTKHNDKQTVVCPATLGNDAGIIGAAFLGNNTAEA